MSALLSDAPRATVVALFLVLSLVLVFTRRGRVGLSLRASIVYLWFFFLVFSISEVVSFKIGVWILATLSFLALREYFTLVDIRLQDRWGIVGAYLAIPFMIYFIQIDWYGMFIVSIPVYAFLVIPFLVTLGGEETEGTVFSIGAIDFGLFLLVYCIGHIGYLALYSTWMAILLVLGVALSDAVTSLSRSVGRPFPGRAVIEFAAPVPATVALACALSGWTGIPWNHSIAVGLLIPALAAVGRRTIAFVEMDLGIGAPRLRPGRGQIIDSLKPYLYASPVVFHYIRYFLK